MSAIGMTEHTGRSNGCTVTQNGRVSCLDGCNNAIGRRSAFAQGAFAAFSDGISPGIHPKR